MTAWRSVIMSIEAEQAWRVRGNMEGPWQHGDLSTDMSTDSSGSAENSVPRHTPEAD